MKTEEVSHPSTTGFSEPGLNIGPVKRGIESSFLTAVSRMGEGEWTPPTIQLTISY